MKALLSYLPALGCAGMMAVCMGLFSRNRGAAPGASASATLEDEVVALRAEVAALRAEAGQPTVEPANGRG